ncbi:hypothetical protein [Anaeroselena agilis]|uniref:Minor capsid protein n=1 Tax=Anaeroselena agilis TaxID=3063788 RepID=A0ABU3NV07_9FIRM|nr:hypothetical protein [Selenomonadales bacterium 4137-cl]
MGVLTALGTALGIYGQVEAYNAQGRAAQQQGQAAITNMNYAFQNYEIQRRDAFDAAVEQIASTRLNAQSLNAGADVAINEKLGAGRTATLLKRSVRGDEARKVAAIQSNYQQKSNEVDLNKEAQLISTKNRIANIKTPSKTALMVGVASSLVKGVSAMEEQRLHAEENDLDWDFWGGAKKKGG